MCRMRHIFQSRSPRGAPVRMTACWICLRRALPLSPSPRAHAPAGTRTLSPKLQLRPCRSGEGSHRSTTFDQDITLFHPHAAKHSFLDRQRAPSLTLGTRPKETMARTNFSDEQRAEIFVLDRATCCYSGRSLWIADYGIDPSYQIDWADHIVPASRGGKSIVENGAAASCLYNYLRGNGRQKLVFFRRGLPTADHKFHVGVIDPAVIAQLHRFRALHLADWFLNRAMWHVWIGITLEHERQQGLSRSRDYNYYAGAALKCLTKWLRLVEKDSVGTWEQRGLVSPTPEADQQQLLEIRQSTSTRSLVEMMKDLFPVYDATAKAMLSLCDAKNAATISRIMSRVESHKRIPRRIRKRLMQYAKSLRRLVQ